MRIVGEQLPAREPSDACPARSPQRNLPCELLSNYAHSFHRNGRVTWDGESQPSEFAEQRFQSKGDPAAELMAWWLEIAHKEAEAVVPKAVEYGATDLSDIGNVLARILGRKVTDAEAAEMGVFFYLEGKFARWRSALERGDRVSDDTLHDIGVYIRMAQRIREAGNWPGVSFT